MPPRRIIAVVLAGGLSTRMGGGDKGLLDLAGRPILAHVVDRLRPQVAEVVLNANGDPARLSGFGCTVVPDALPDHPGPLAGMLAGLGHAATRPDHPTHIVFAPSDTPFLPRDLVARLAAALPDEGAADRTIAMPVSSGGSQQAACLVPVTLGPDLADHLAAGGRRSIKAWLERHPVVEVPFPDDAGRDPFFNVNTPADLERARELGTGPRGA